MLKTNDVFDDDEQSVVGKLRVDCSGAYCRGMDLDELRTQVSKKLLQCLAYQVLIWCLMMEKNIRFAMKWSKIGQPDNIKGKRICRSETPSKAHRVEQDAHKMDAKTTRTGLRTLHERKSQGISTIT